MGRWEEIHKKQRGKCRKVGNGEERCMIRAVISGNALEEREQRAGNQGGHGKHDCRELEERNPGEAVMGAGGCTTSMEKKQILS